MKNIEKYARDVIAVACGDGVLVSVDKDTNRPINCGDTDCEKCLFFDKEDDCTICFEKWCNEEYEEPKVDWNKVKVDTPILVSNDNENWYKRHFAKYESGLFYAWDSGNTSWSVKAGNNPSRPWAHAKLAEDGAIYNPNKSYDINGIIAKLEEWKETVNYTDDTFVKGAKSATNRTIDRAIRILKGAM